MRAVAAARADEVEILVEEYLRTSQGSAIAARRQAISDALVDAVECRQRLEAAERAASGLLAGRPAEVAVVDRGAHHDLTAPPALRSASG